MSPIRRTLAALSLGAALAAPLAAQEMAELCRAALHITPGQWSSYRYVGGKGDGTTMRLAIVNTARVSDSTFYWYEMRTVQGGKTEQDATIVQMLVAGLGTPKIEIRDLVMKSGTHKAMRYPQMLLHMMAGPIAKGVASETGRRCTSERIEVVGWESVTVPAGTMRALHLKDVESGGDAWFSPQVPFGTVKVVGKDGFVMELTASGHDAKSSITETPQEMGH